jgi:hypothetical protein
MMPLAIPSGPSLSKVAQFEFALKGHGFEPSRKPKNTAVDLAFEWRSGSPVRFHDILYRLLSRHPLHCRASGASVAV